MTRAIPSSSFLLLGIGGIDMTHEEFVSLVKERIPWVEEVLGDYRGPKEKVKVRCKNGHEVEVDAYSLAANSVNKRRKRCPVCFESKPSKEKLEYCWRNQLMNIWEMEKEFNASHNTIWGWLNFYKIQRTPEEIEEAKKLSIEKRFGKDGLACEEIVKKRENTCNEKYGGPNPMVSVEIRQKMKDTSLKKYGATNYIASLLPEETRVVLSSRENFEKFILENKYITTLEISTALKTSVHNINQKLTKYDLWHLIHSRTSGPEMEIRHFLENNGIRFTKPGKRFIPPYEIDILCKDYDIAIEFNGDYWHRAEKVGREYHLTKTRLMREKGVYLFHIFEYQWRNPEMRKLIESKLLSMFSGEYEKNIEIMKEKGVKEVELDIARENFLLYEKHGYCATKAYPPSLDSSGAYPVYDCGKIKYVLKGE